MRSEVSIEHDERAKRFAYAHLADAECVFRVFLIVSNERVRTRFEVSAESCVVHQVAVLVSLVARRTVAGTRFSKARLDVGIVAVDEVLACGNPLVDFVRRVVTHAHNVVVRVHVVRHLAHASPAEVGVHLVLVSPLVRKSPDSVVVVINERLAVEYAAFLVNVERNAQAALEHIIGVVHVGERAVVWLHVVLLEAEQIVFPRNEAVEHVHVLAIADRRSVSSLAVVVQPLGRPYGVNLRAHQVHTRVDSVGCQFVHLFVALVGREVAVHLSVDEVYLELRLEFGVLVGIVANVSQAVPVVLVINDVQAVVERVRSSFGVTSVEISADFAHVPCRYEQRH